MSQTTEDTPAISQTAPGGVGLLIVDMINDFDFEGAEPLRGAALALARRLTRFRTAADALGVPVIYVNDNFGHWRSERSRIVEHVGRQDSPGREIVDLIEPRESDFFVIKPRFSGFYATNLQVLLPKLGVDRLILTGVATDICVLFTAADAYMREYRLWVPEDLVASEDPQRSAWALDIMRNSMGAHTAPSSADALAGWLKASRR